MRCSSCEALLDRYVEGTLSDAEARSLEQHLAHCERCRDLLEELKVVDALLLTARPPELPPNFTYAVMAEVNSLPLPRTSRRSAWGLVALYLAGAWAAAFVALWVAGIAPPAMASAISSGALHFAGQLGTVYSILSRSFGRQTPELTAFGFGVLVLDAAVAGGVALLHINVRPRLAAHLAIHRERM